MVRFDSKGPKLVAHCPFGSKPAQVGRSRSVLIVSGPNWSIVIRFDSFGPKSVNRGSF